MDMQANVYVFQQDDNRSVKQRLEYIAEEYCGTQADMIKELGFENLQDLKNSLQVKKTETGKPYFPNCSKLHFSISHSGQYWVCAIAPVNIGVDIQEHVIGRNETRKEAIHRFKKMAHRFFHPLEARFVEYEEAPEDSFYHFFTVWTAREAYVKYTGSGIDKEFSEHCVVCEDFEKLSLEAAQWQAMNKWFRKTIFKGCCSLCICSEEALNWIVREC